MFARFLIALMLASSSLMLTQASAQPNKPRSSVPIAAPKVAAPPPVRPAAPAAVPHVSAPRIAPSPRLSIPQHLPQPPRVAAPPRFQTPQHFTRPPRVTAPPRIAAPSRSAPSRLVVPPARHRVASPRPPSITQGVRESRSRFQRPSPGQTVNLNRTQSRQLRTEERQQIRRLQAQHRQHLRDLRTQGQRLDHNALRQLRAQNERQLRDLRRQFREQRLGLQKPQPPGIGLRPNGRARITPESVRQGRFAARFAHRADRGLWRVERVAAWLAWKRHRRAAFVAWGRGVFWPYVYTDLFYYAFWPQAYDDGYWAYVYDDFVDSIYWANGNPYAEYPYAAPTAESIGVALGRIQKLRQVSRGAPDVCEPDKGITAWPFQQIERVVQPTTQQQLLLDQLKEAAAQAASSFKASCTLTSALTPTGRLQAMLDRLQATIDAVHKVRPPLVSFYDSLTDEQKARFNAIDPVAKQEVRTSRNEPQDTNACVGQKPGLTDLPIERIEDVLRPTEAQTAVLERLSKATDNAVTILQGACPDNIPQTPVGRLDAIEKRLDAMIQAAKTVQPALQEFYASLTDEQKSRFNTLGQQALR
jgi:LTXXQ motif family protein